MIAPGADHAGAKRRERAQIGPHVPRRAHLSKGIVWLGVLALSLLLWVVLIRWLTILF